MKRTTFLKLAAFSSLGMLMTFPVLGSGAGTMQRIKKLLEEKTGLPLDEEFELMLELKNQLVSYNSAFGRYAALADKHADEVCNILNAGHADVAHYLKYEATDVQQFVKQLLSNAHETVTVVEHDYDFIIAQVKKIADIGINHCDTALKKELMHARAGIAELELKGYGSAMEVITEKTGIIKGV